MLQPREAPKPGVVEVGLSETFGVLGRSVTAGLRGSDKGRRGVWRNSRDSIRHSPRPRSLRDERTETLSVILQL